MRLLFLFGTLLLAMSAKAQTSAHTVWDELRTKREQLPSLHQEFDVSQTYRSASSTQASKRQVLIDMAGDNGASARSADPALLCGFSTAATCFSWTKAAMNLYVRNGGPKKMLRLRRLTA